MLFLLNSVSPKGTFVEFRVMRMNNGKGGTVLVLDGTAYFPIAVLRQPGCEQKADQFQEWLTAHNLEMEDSPRALAILKGKARATANALTTWKSPWHEGDAAFANRKNMRG